MENLLIVAKQVAILFALMGVGCVCRRAKLIDEASVKGMVNVLILVVTPCLIVNCFERPFDSSMLKGLGVAFLFSLGAHFLAMSLARLLVREKAVDTRCVLRVSTVFSNAGFMGIPMEHAILGDVGVFYGIVAVVVFNLLIWSWGLAVMRGGSSRINTMMFVNPGTIGIAMGMAVFVMPWNLPHIVHEPIAMMSSLNTPLAMIVIGYYLAGARLSSVLRSSSAHVATVLRLIVVPLLVTAAMYPFRHVLDRTMMLATIIPAAAPVGAMVTMFASKHKRDVDMSVGMVSGTTLLSIVTMPVVIAIAMEVL